MAFHAEYFMELPWNTTGLHGVFIRFARMEFHGISWRIKLGPLKCRTAHVVNVSPNKTGLFASHLRAT